VYYLSEALPGTAEVILTSRGS